MFNDPSVGETITLDGKSYEFLQVADTPGIVYAEMGKKAKVYRVVQGSRAYALKVFKPVYRTSKLLTNMSHISAHQRVPGLAVAERIILTPEKFPDVLQEHSEFTYAILMPWIEGRSWANCVISRTALTANESVRLAKAFAKVICELEKNDIGHCDLSGGNFIFSHDYNHVELVDIEELYGPNFPKPDILPAGTSGYSPDWVKEKGLWGPNADRFAAGILICEILTWQFEDIRNASNKGDSFFAAGELCHESKRSRLMAKRLLEIHPELANLFRTVWHANQASDCPKISEWNAVLSQLGGLSSEPSWGWESLDLPSGVGQVVTKNVVQPQFFEEVRNVETSQPTDRTTPEQDRRDDGPVVAKEWPARGTSRTDLLIRIFSVFAVVGVITFLLILIFGNTINTVGDSFKKQGGWIVLDMISNSILGLLVGSVHAWIFRNNIRRSHIGLFILAAFLGGAIGGATTGFLTDLDFIKNAYLAGAITGSIAGALSSLGQNLFMQSKGLQIKWFLFSLISWFVIWIVGTAISWSNQTIPGIAATAALIILSSGAALSAFLHQYPDVEF